MRVVIKSDGAAWVAGRRPVWIEIGTLPPGVNGPIVAGRRPVWIEIVKLSHT